MCQNLQKALAKTCWTLAQNRASEKVPIWKELEPRTQAREPKYKRKTRMARRNWEHGTTNVTSARVLSSSYVRCGHGTQSPISEHHDKKI